MTKARVSTTRGPLPERFQDHVQQGAGCWDWRGSLHPTGYGIIGDRGRQLMAHRVAYELHVGPIPEGLYIDHLCRNRACVNPAHLEPVTNGVNVLRGEGAAAQNARKTHCVRGHEFTAANTYRPPGRPNARYCRACIAEKRAVA